jgi:hypothetical protein
VQPIAHRLSFFNRPPGEDRVSQLTSVDKGFQDVLLDAEIVVANLCQLISKLWEVLHSLLDSIVADVIGGWLGAQAEVIADILLEEAVCMESTILQAMSFHK